MKINKKMLIVVLIAFVLFILFSLNNYFSGDIHVIHQFTIQNKETLLGKYYITGYYGIVPELKEIQFELKDTDSFIYEEGPRNREHVYISEVWALIEEDQDYYIVFKENKFPWNIFRKYNLLEFHGY
ncbi:hypothetical protein [Alkaliphilus transvaalensis]|uniref:hypothetical protein n=1 Tax=Alkaliphilus transvaalensis TaxID=114628 RepID=UPI00047B51B9|nr:hypothetical protein [Alkaliphilus transvaalensis]